MTPSITATIAAPAGPLEGVPVVNPGERFGRTFLVARETLWGGVLLWVVEGEDAEDAVERFSRTEEGAFLVPSFADWNAADHETNQDHDPYRPWMVRTEEVVAWYNVPGLPPTESWRLEPPEHFRGEEWSIAKD